jgi:hypothetical protein
MVPLSSLFPDQGGCAAYLKTTVTAPQDMDAVLLLASDDGIKAWLNGEVVHANNIDLGAVADQDMVPVRLKAGANELLLKVTQGGGGWAACARLVSPEGQPIPGLNYQATPEGGGDRRRAGCRSGDPRKAVLAVRLRAQTMPSVAWIATRLGLLTRQ